MKEGQRRWKKGCEPWLKKLLEQESRRTGKKLTQKEFVLGLIQRALDEAEREGAAGHGADLE